MGVPRGASIRCFGGAAMPSVGTLCQLLALGLLVETRLQLAAQKQPQHNDSSARRDLGDTVTEAVVEAIVGDRVEAAVAKMRAGT
jgi:hypothetical protein